MEPLSCPPSVHKWPVPQRDGSKCRTGTVVLMWNGDSGADTWCPAMETMCQIMFYNHLATFGTIVKSAKGPQVGWFHNGKGPDVERDSSADTWCPAMQPMCQMTFYTHLATFGNIVKSAKGPQMGRFHNGMGPDVERGQWCGHLVSGHKTNVSNHVL